MKHQIRYGPYGRTATYEDIALCVGEEVGFMSEDLFVLVRKSRPLMRHKPENQKHARRNHSYFLVMRRKT